MLTPIKVDIFQTKKNGDDVYLGFKSMETLPHKGDIITYMFHQYKVDDVRNNTLFCHLWN